MKTRSQRSSARKHPHVDAGNKYARDVVAGRIPACKWIVLACKRHLDDLKASKTRAFRYKFDPAIGEKWCVWIELFPHVKGKWARTKEKLKLEPWQCFMTMCIFGWIRKSDGLRRFRQALLLVPRKNAKSTWAAPVGLGGLILDGEPGAEVYTGATTKKQAWEIFRPARTMAQRSPGLLKAGLFIGAANLHVLSSESRMEPLVGNPGDGASPSMALIDEYHEHASDRMVDTMVTGMGAREQPLLIIVTTAGDNLAGPCYAMQTEAQKMLEGVIDNDEVFALIYTVDKEDDWTSETALRKANPNYDVSVGGEFLRSRQREAVNNPRKAGIFKTKHLNLWVQARNAFFNVQRWQESERSEISLEDFYGQPVRLGLDLASKIDIAAMEIVFDLDECDCDAAMRLRDDGFKYARFGRYYLPEDTVNNTANEHYAGWVEAGLIIQTDGDMIDYLAIKDDVYWMRDTFQLEEVAFDPHQAMMMISELMNDGVNCVIVRQQVLTMSEPMKQMDGEIRSRQIAHNGDPVFTWMLSNVVAKEDAKDNVYPRKERSENKIDGPVAHIMVKARLMSEDTTTSVYETRGALVV